MRLNEAEQSMYRSRVTEVILNAAAWIVTNDCQCFVFRLLTGKKKKASENNRREQTRQSISEDGLLADLPLLMAAH